MRVVGVVCVVWGVWSPQELETPDLEDDVMYDGSATINRVLRGFEELLVV